MKKLFTLTLTLLMLLSLASCKKEEEPPAPQSGTSIEATSRFSDLDFSKRYYKSCPGQIKGTAYINNYYYMGTLCQLQEIPLPTGGENENEQVSKVACSDPMCPHYGPDGMNCPAYMRDPNANFLLDATESGGEAPIFYYSRCTADNIAFDNAWESNQEYELVRYDSSESVAKRVTAVNYPIKQFMTYGDRIYFLTQTASDRYEISSVKKSGGEVTTHAPGDGLLHLIGADETGVYVNDTEGNVYAYDLSLGNERKIYTVAEVYPMDETAPADLGMFIADGQLCFFADFKVEVIPYGSVSLDLVKTNIRRVKLSDPDGEGELVASDVYQNTVYGVYNGVMYYAPFNVTVNLEVGAMYSPVSISNGTICKVDLKTLEKSEVITDSGLNFTRAGYLNDRCIIAATNSYREIEGVNPSGNGTYPSLLDFETGAIYNAYNGVRLYDGTIGQ